MPREREGYNRTLADACQQEIVASPSHHKAAIFQVREWLPWGALPALGMCRLRTTGVRMARRFRESHLPCGRARPGARRQIRKEPEGIAAVRLHRLRAGGGLGIRTPEGTLWPLTRLAGEHLRPLGQPSARRTRIAHSRPFDNRKFKQSQSRAPKPRELRKGGHPAGKGIPPRRESYKDGLPCPRDDGPAARLRPLSRIRSLSRKTIQAPRRRPGAP